LVDQLHEKKSAQTADTSREDTAARGDPLLGLIREKSIFVGKNDLNVFDMEVAPGVMWDSLNEFNAEQNCGWTIEKIEGKGF